MAKPQKSKVKVTKPQDIELVDDAWPRFEKMVKAIAKAGPQHKQTSASKGGRKRGASKN